METQRVDPRTVSVWRWYGAFWVLLATLAGALIYMSLLQAQYPEAGAWVLAAIAVSGLAFDWLWPAACYRNLHYSVDAAGIVIRSGVLWRSDIALPRTRIQHTDVSQGPLQRRFGIGTLTLYTAGSRYTKIELPGLSYGHAMALRDSLISPEEAVQSSDSGV